MIYIYSSTNRGWLKEKGLFLFDRPVYKIRYKNRILQINDRKIKTDKPLHLIQKLIKNYYAVGFISYDFKDKTLGRNRIQPVDTLKLPDIYINLYKKYKKINNLHGYKSKIIRHRIQESKEEYINKVEKIKEYITVGDIYQINLAHRIEIEGFFSVENIFKNLIETQPTDYLMLIKDKDFSLISGSMELFLEKNGDCIISKPIKGTVKRGKNPEEDEKLKLFLKNNEKERAENLMITDLMRNDIGRISKSGSVKVPELFTIEKYSSLYQMSSTVEGELKENVSLKDIIQATFPPGSVTGAPKIRAVQIIDQLEKYKRSVYCGTTFVIKPDSDFVMSVAIRQSIFKKNRCYIYIGSGIVADSIPEKEYEETILKSKANIKSIG